MTDFDTCLLLNSSFGSRPLCTSLSISRDRDIVRYMYRKMIKPHPWYTMVIAPSVAPFREFSLECRCGTCMAFSTSWLLSFGRLFQSGPAVVLRAKFDIKGHLFRLALGLKRMPLLLISDTRNPGLSV